MVTKRVSGIEFQLRKRNWGINFDFVSNISATTTVVLRRQKHVGNNSDRPVRRISYLRATANDTSAQEITVAEETAAIAPCADISEKGEPVEDDLRVFLNYLKR